MSDANVPNDAISADPAVADPAQAGASPDVASEVPTLDELDHIAIRGTLRRRPRLGRILGTGITGGALLGLILGLSLPNSTGVGRGLVGVLLALSFGLIGGLAFGAIATRMDRLPKEETQSKRSKERAARRAAPDQEDTP